jgi:hypothetical protein
VLVGELLAYITGVGPRRLGARIRRATVGFGTVGATMLAIVAIVVGVTIVVVTGRKQ